MYLGGKELDDPNLRFIAELCENPTIPLNPNRSVLDIITATKDTHAWVSDTRKYSEKHRPAWVGSIKDLWRAIDALGPAVKAELDSPIKRLRTGLAEMPYKATATSERKNAQAAIEYWATKLSDPSVVGASWLDLVNSSSNERISWEKLAQYRDTVWALAQNIGHSLTPSSAATTVQAILHDQKLDVANARIAAGIVSPSTEQGLDDPWGTAGLSRAERVELCQSFLGSPNYPTAHNVFWFAFDQADAPAMRGDYGSVQIFDSEWLYGNLVNDGPFKHELPEELLTEGFFDAEHLPHERGVALMRVDLGQCKIAESQTLAEEVARTIVEFARPWDGASWRFRSGYLHSIDGHIRGFGTFGVAEHMEKSRWIYSQHGSNLHDLIPQVSDYLPWLTPEFRQTVRAKQWLHEAGNTSDPARLLLTVRVLELHSSWISGGQDAWTKYSRQYLKKAWIIDAICGQYVNRLREGLTGSGFRIIPDDQTTRMREIFLKFQRSEGNDRYRFVLSEALPHITWLADVYGAHTIIGRQLADLARKASSAQLLRQFVERSSQDFNNLLERLQRLRNSIMHGGPIPEESITPPINFGRYLAEISLQRTVGIVIEGKDLIAGHAEARDARAAVYEKMCTEGTIPD